MEYRLICNAEELRPYLSMLTETKLMAVDIETTGLDPRRDAMRLIQLAMPDAPVIIVDCFSFLPAGLDMLKQVFEHSSIKVFHNAKFDLQFLLAMGIEVPHIFDTMLAAQLLHSSGGPMRVNLNAVSQHYLGEEVDKGEQKSDWAHDLTSTQLAYSAKDAEILLRLRDKMIPIIYANGLGAIAKIEFNCVSAIAHMEYHGISIDLAQWNELIEQTESMQLQALEKLYEYCPRPRYQLSLWGEDVAVSGDRNFESNAFVLRLLKQNGIDVPSTSRRYLSHYAKHPLARALSEYRKHAKALSSFLYPIPTLISPITGRLHPKYGQIGAWSGRMNCGGPNIQQIPREAAFRRCFCAPFGKKLIVADYSQIELRVAAQISGDHRMTAAYRQGKDLHAITASLISEVPMDAVTKTQRQAAKAVNFGLIFGMGAAGLQQYALQSYGVEMSMEESTKFRDSFFRAYPGIAAWHRRIKDTKPTEERSLTGRKFTFSENAGTSALYNTPVQGTAADIAKAALGALVRRIKGTNIKIIAIVHDEILLEADEGEAAMAAILLKEVMEHAGNAVLSAIPCVADVNITDSWAGK